MSSEFDFNILLSELSLCFVIVATLKAIGTYIHTSIHPRNITHLSLQSGKNHCRAGAAQLV